MDIDTRTLIWLFPVAFMWHDFEEIILGERWLQNNRADLKQRLRKIFPPSILEKVDRVFQKSTAELAFAVSLIFTLTVLASFLADVYAIYGPFLFASGLFFLHGWMHVGQAVALRRYVPAVISSIIVVIPYGLLLFARLFAEGLVRVVEIVVYLLAGMVLMIPFILIMHQVGERVYRLVARLAGR